MSSKDKDLNEWWYDALMGATFESKGRKIFKMFPAGHRCKMCYAPFDGVFAPLMKLIKKGSSIKNGNICQFCEEFAREHMLGTEIEISLLFADVRGSTTMAEGLSPTEFTAIMNNFFRIANTVLVKYNALIDKMVGDEVIGLFIPGLAGKNHPSVAINTALELAEQLKRDDKASNLPIGMGVHTGIAYVGTVGTKETSVDITAMGDNVNITARLASMAGAGEILITDDCISRSNLRDALKFSKKELELKGKSEKVGVHSILVK
jgi:adenylate cyclase